METLGDRISQYLEYVFGGALILYSPVILGVDISRYIVFPTETNVDLFAFIALSLFIGLLSDNVMTRVYTVFFRRQHSERKTHLKVFESENEGAKARTRGFEFSKRILRMGVVFTLSLVILSFLEPISQAFRGALISLFVISIIALHSLTLFYLGHLETVRKELEG